MEGETPKEEKSEDVVEPPAETSQNAEEISTEAPAAEQQETQPENAASSAQETEPTVTDDTTENKTEEALTTTRSEIPVTPENTEAPVSSEQATTEKTEEKEATATVKFQLVPSTDVITIASPLSINISGLKDSVAADIDVSTNEIQIRHNGEEVNLQSTLQELGVSPNATIQFEVLATDPSVSLKPSKLKKQAGTPDVITVRVPKENNEFQEVVVEIERHLSNKPFIGGFRHKLSGTQFHHAAVQTQQAKAKISPIEKFSRDCQTVLERNHAQQTTSVTSTQMPKVGCYISTDEDKIISPRKYTPYDEYMKQRIKAVVCKYRSCPSFRRRVEDGKASICNKHFIDDDIQKCNKKSWIKIGSIPSLNLPKKSHEVTPPPPRRILQRHVIDDSSSGAKNITKIYNSNIEDIINAYNSIPIKKWRLYSIDSCTVHFTYYYNSNLHATPSISLLVSKTSNEDFVMSCAFDGAYTPARSDSFSLKLNSLSSVLKQLTNCNICMGYKDVIDKDEWHQKFTPGILMDKSIVITSQRFISCQCEVIFMGKGDNATTCTMCMKLHVLQEESKKRKSSRLEKLKNVPLGSHSTLATASRERLLTTVVNNRQRIEELKNEMLHSGVTVSENMSSMMEKM